MAGSSERWDRARRAGVLLPVLYFAAALGLGALTPGHDAARDIVSLIGAAGAPHAAAFNALMIASGLAGLAGAVGLAGPGARAVARRVCAAALLLTGVGNVWAGLFPLPDARHLTNPGLPGIVLLPLVAIPAVPPGRARRVLVAGALLFAGVAAVRLFGWDAGARGLWQRLHALTAYSPAAVLALARRPLADGVAPEPRRVGRGATASLGRRATGRSP
jgi:hypothetical membrane protein